MQKLIQKFKTNAELTTSVVEIINSADLSKTIENQIRNEKEILVNIYDPSILDSISQSINFIKTPSPDQLKNIKVCITNSVCGIVETGSVVIDNDNWYNSYLTMLTSKHIVILDSKDLYGKPRDIFNSSRLKNSSSFSIITGPSATADMGSLVRGVHGPEKLHIIISVHDE